MLYFPPYVKPIIRHIIKMANDLIVPEIKLIEKLEEMETTLSPAVWQQMKNNVEVYSPADEKLPVPVRMRKTMVLSDFVNKAINMPLEIIPALDEAATKQLYRLHIFCCQQTIHRPDIRRNPLTLGFRALEEMHTALVGIFISYRLIHPECPYSWSKEFFNERIFTDKAADGHSIIKFKRPITEDIINAALNEDIVTDWLIYRAYDRNGIRTLMDIRNNLLTIPDYKCGGEPVAEFSRFERKMQEQRNKKEQHKNETLDLEFRKTLIQKVAEQTANQLFSSGISTMDLLQQAYNGDLSALFSNIPQNTASLEKSSENKKKLTKKVQNTKEIDNIIAGFLEESDS